MTLPLHLPTEPSPALPSPNAEGPRSIQRIVKVFLNGATGFLLAYGQQRFLGLENGIGSAILFASVFSVLGLLGALILPRRPWPIGVLARAAVALAAGLVSALLIRHSLGAETFWLGAAAGLFSRFACHGVTVAAVEWPEHRTEGIRWAFLAVAAGLLYQPFFTQGSVGGGEAGWYSLMLGDFAEQWRSGVFPVWTGQSLYAFNGAVDPLRVAPLLPHLAGVLDLITFQSLHPTALKNLTLATLALFATLSAYFSFRFILGRLPWVAVALAVLWMESPGVMGLPFGQDLDLCVACLPFIPVVFACLWGLGTGDRLTIRITLSAALAGAWLSHAPMAVWLSAIAVVVWALRLRRPEFRKSEKTLLAVSVVAFLGLALFPFASLASLGALENHVQSAQRLVENTAASLQTSFSPRGTTGQQPGLAALLLAATGIAAAARAQGSGRWFFPATGAAVGLVLFSIPGSTLHLWKLVPSGFMAIPGDGIQQGLMGIWTFVLLASFATAVGTLAQRAPSALRLGALGILGAGVLWSTAEALKLRRYASGTSGSASAALKATLPNNVVIGRSSYRLFPVTPDTVTQGYADPRLEARLLERESEKVLLSNAEAVAPRVRPSRSDGFSPRLIAWGTLQAKSAGGGLYPLSPGLPIPSGVAVALRLSFDIPAFDGSLQATSEQLFREYILPDSGRGLDRSGPPASFGMLPTSSGVIPLGRSEAPQVLALQLISTAQTQPASFVAAHYWLYRYGPEDLPVNVYSLIPYKAEVNAPAAAWVETCRMWLEGYRARVDQRPVPARRSPNGLVMVPVPAGRSTIRIDYSPPLSLAATYWIAVVGWLGIFGLLALRYLMTRVPAPE